MAVYIELEKVAVYLELENVAVYLELEKVAVYLDLEKVNMYICQYLTVAFPLWLFEAGLRLDWLRLLGDSRWLPHSVHSLQVITSLPQAYRLPHR